MSGIAGWDLNEAADRAFAFDYDHSGKLDHIVLYRPGRGAIAIIRHNNDNTFTPVYDESDPGRGIGGYDLNEAADRAFAFDYDHSGKLDHPILYRPGVGIIWILDNVTGRFEPAFYSILPPSDLKAKVVPPTSTQPAYAILSWTGNQPYVTGVDLEVVIGSGDAQPRHLDGLVLSFTEHNLTPETRYQIRVRWETTLGPSEYTEPVSFTAPPAYEEPEKLADLAFIENWINPALPDAGQPFFVYFRFGNAGNAPTGSFTARLVLDGNRQSLDIQATSYAPGVSDLLYWNFPNGLPDGRHYVDAYLDIRNQVKESTKGNNQSNCMFIVF